MNEMRLRYELDPNTGLPGLRGSTGALSREDRQALQAALASHYDRLARGQLTRVRLQLSSGRVSFRVEVVAGASPRCPALLLRRVSPAGAKVSWVEELAREWEELLAGAVALGEDEEVQRLEEAIGWLRREGAAPGRLAEVLFRGWHGEKEAEKKALPCRSLAG